MGTLELRVRRRVTAIITTARLTLRTWSSGDLREFLELTSHPDVNRFINHGKPVTTAGAETFLQRQMRTQDERGWCRWAVELHEEPGRAAGWCGVGCTFAPEIELGWTLRRDLWGRGLATEGAAAALAYCFAVVGFERVIACIDPANDASRRVAERLAMKPDGTLHIEGLEVIRYAMTNPSPPAKRNPRFILHCAGEPGGPSLQTSEAEQG